MAYRPKRPEDAIHERAVAELRLSFSLRGYARGDEPFFHCPNEGKRSKQHTAKLFRLGFSSGVSDLVIVFPTVLGHPGAALELKARRGQKPSKAQKTWLDHWERIGFAVACTGGHEDTAKMLVRWGYIHQTQADGWLRWASRG